MELKVYPVGDTERKNPWEGQWRGNDVLTALPADQKRGLRKCMIDRCSGSRGRLLFSGSGFGGRLRLLGRLALVIRAAHGRTGTARGPPLETRLPGGRHGTGVIAVGVLVGYLVNSPPQRPPVPRVVADTSFAAPRRPSADRDHRSSSSRGIVAGCRSTGRGRSARCGGADSDRRGARGSTPAARHGLKSRPGRWQRWPAHRGRRQAVPARAGVGSDGRSRPQPARAGAPGESAAAAFNDFLGNLDRLFRR